MKLTKQIQFIFKTHGGRRKGAGRKKRLKHELPHTARPEINWRTPGHVTLKLKPGRPGLRTPKFLRAFLRAIRRAKKCGLEIQHFAIEGNHIHLILEAESKPSLERGMGSLIASITWALRKIFRFFGPVFVSRYHISPISSPREMKNTLRYVLFNHAKHLGQPAFADAYSSVYVFKDLAVLQQIHCDPPPWFAEILASVSAPRSWLQSQGWKRSS